MIPPGTQLCWCQGQRLIYIPDYYGSRWYQVPAEGLVPVPTTERITAEGGGAA